MVTACGAAENLLGAGHDVWAINLERFYQEEFTRPERETAGPRRRAG